MEESFRLRLFLLSTCSSLNVILYSTVKRVQYRKELRGVVFFMSDYFSLYVLSYFDLDRSTNASQILHVFHGKRTPSMFYRIEKNGWHPGFQLSKNIQMEHLEKIINSHLQNGWLVKYEKGYSLTKSGLEATKDYFEKHYYPQKIRTFTNANIRNPFWERWQLFSQVFSELSYQSNSYTPIIKHPHHQESVRHLFYQFNTEKESLLKQWIKEQSFIFHQMDDKTADVIMNQLTGYKKIGQTKEQIRNTIDMEFLEFQFYMNDILEVFIQTINQHDRAVPIHVAIINSIFIEHNYGLSASTKHTYDLLKIGRTPTEIANIRRLKLNTIKEHLLEIAFVFEEFPYEKFIPKELYGKLKLKFEHQKDYTYKEAVEDFEQLEFIHFRLTELERMRHK